MRAQARPSAARLPWAALGLCALLACRADTASGHPPELPGPSAPDAAGVAPELEPLCDALGRAVRAREDEEARRLLARLWARAPRGRAAELARGYEAILAGRAELEQLELELLLEPFERAAEPFSSERARLVLRVRQPGPGPLDVRLGPATLVSALEVVTREGREGAWRETRNLDPLGRATLAAGEELRLPLAEVELAAPPGALAARSRFELCLRSGELLRGGRALPAADPRLAPLVVVRTDRRLSERAVEPAELALAFVRGLTDEESALELAVRVRPERADEALDLIAPLAADASLPALRSLVPALRWLAPRAALGGDVLAWRAFLDARAERRAERSAGEEGTPRRLELPPPPARRAGGLAARGGEGERR